MLKKLRALSLLLCFSLSLSALFGLPNKTLADGNFEAQLAQFPSSYHAGLRQLHAEHPTWCFYADKINMTFDYAVNAEYNTPFRKGVNMNNDGVSWRSMNDGCFDWQKNAWNTFDEGRWTGAAREVIAYYMDPRNFLDSRNAFMFFQQSYNSESDNKAQTTAGLRSQVSGTFLANGYTDPNDQYSSYIDVIMAAAEASGVNPYVIAATLIQEQGTNGTSGLISGTYSGYEGYYNFFNFRATGTNVVANGLSFAVTKGWNTRSKSIIYGAVEYASNYISRGQDTYYYKDFNVRNGINSDFNHQYAQSVYDAIGCSRTLSSSVVSKHENLNFFIPVYTSMPEAPAPKPEENSKKANYYLSSLSAAGLSPSFSMYNYTYNLSVSGDTTVNMSLLAGTSIVSAMSCALSAGNNTVPITVMAENGYTNTYTLKVSASVPCTLTLSTDYVKARLGDTNGDGNIDVVDLANVQKYIVGRIYLSGSAFEGADTNSDGSVDVIDLANIQKHIVGRITLS